MCCTYLIPCSPSSSMTYVSSLLRPLCRGEKKKKKVSLLVYRLTVRAKKKKKERDNLRNLCCEDDPLKIKTWKRGWTWDLWNTAQMIPALQAIGNISCESYKFPQIPFKWKQETLHHTFPSQWITENWWHSSAVFVLRTKSFWTGNISATPVFPINH